MAMLLISKKIYYVLLFFVAYSQLFAQGPYSTVNIDNIKIYNFNYNIKISDIKKTLGEPEYYNKYEIEDGDGPAGWDKMYYIDYDSISFRFIEYYGDTIISKIIIKGHPYFINFNETKINIGDSLMTLRENFQKSYEYFQKQHPKPYNKNEQYFYLNLKIEYPDYIYYGLINITLKNDIIKEISFRFDDGT